jgi:hypothetical protein
MSVTWITKVDVTPGTTESWQDVDVSSYIPAGATGVILRIRETALNASYTMGIRNNGSTDTTQMWTTNYFGHQHGTMYVGVDGSRVFEAYVGASCFIELIGYFTTEATFYVNMIDVDPGITGSWADVDISSDTSPDTATAAILSVTNFSVSDTYKLRKNGSTDEIPSSSYCERAAGRIVGVDANQIFEHYASSNNSKTYLFGYLTTDITTHTNMIDRDTGSYGSGYYDMTALPSGSSGGLYFMWTSVADYGDLRKNGVTDNYGNDLFRAAGWLIEADGSGIIEARLETSSVKVYEAGYTGVVTPVVTTSAIDNIKDTAGDGNGNIISEGESSPTERGFVYDTSSYSDPGDTSPASSNYSNVQNETGTYSTGTFSLTISGLTSGQTYYVRAYAKNDQGYSYGDEVVFVADEISDTDTLDADFDGTTSNTYVSNDEISLSASVSLEDTESFESSLGDWTLGTDDDQDWIRDASGTPSSNTGPSSAQDGTYYIYIEASSPSAMYTSGNEAVIEYDIGSTESGYVDFYYHQYGVDQGTLYLEGWNGSTWTEIWSSTGDQGNQWNHVTTGSSNFVDYSKLRFRDVAAGGWAADVALDLVKVYTGSGYETSGTYESSTFSTTKLNAVGGGTIDWTATLNSQTLTMETNVSTNSGSTWEGWSSVSNGGSIPDITSITTPADGLIKYKASFSGDGTATPELHDVTLTATYSGAGTATNDTRSAKLTGQDTTNSTRSAKITGKSTSNAERPAKTTGSQLTNDTRSAKITGTDSANSERAAKITGKASTNNERAAKITGGGGGADNRIFEFNYYSRNSKGFKILLFDGDTVKYKSPLITPSATPGAYAYTPSSPVSYEIGWNIGHWDNDTGCIPFTSGGDTAYYKTGAAEPNVDDTISWTGNQARSYPLNGEDGNGDVVIGNTDISDRSTLDTATNAFFRETNGPAVQGYSPGGGTETNDERPAKTTGKTTANDTRSAKVTGQDSANSTRSAKTIGTDTANSTRSAKITGQSSDSSDRNAKATGQDTVTGERSAKVTGKSTDSDERNAKTSGSSTANDTRSAKLTGFDTENSQRSAKVTGTDTAADTRAAKITGLGGTADDRPAKLTGTDTANDIRSAKTTGQLTANDSRSAKITGTTTATDTRAAKITGQDTATNERSAKVTGITGANDQRSAKIAGTDTDTSQRAAKLTGQETAASDRSAKVTGTTTTNSDRAAKLTGGTNVNSERSAKLTGTGANWYDDNWPYRVAYTIPASKLEADTDFPIYLDLSRLPAHFHTHVRSDAGDIRITKDDGLTELPREIVNYDAGADTGEVHTKYSGSFDGTDDVSVYVYYGRSSATDYGRGDTYGQDNVFDDDYVAVIHGNGNWDGTASEVEDSSSYRNDGSADAGREPTQVTGQVGKAQYYEPTNEDGAKLPDSASLDIDGSNGISITVIFKPKNGHASVDGLRGILHKQNNHFSNYATKVYDVGLFNDGKLYFQTGDGTTNFNALGSTQTTWNEQWYHAFADWDGTTNDDTFILSIDNGTPDTTTATSSTIQTNNLKLYMGGRAEAGVGTPRPLDGTIDEIRVSKINRGANRRNNEYNNLMDPASFYSVGDVEENPGGTTENSERGAKIIGGIADDRSAKTAGQLSASSERAGKTTGQQTDASNRPAKTTGALGADDERAAKLTGQDADTDDRSAKVTGQDTDNDQRSAKTAGQLAASSDRAAKTHGTETVTSDRSARIIGVLTADSERSAKITGNVSSERSAKLIGTGWEQANEPDWQDESEPDWQDPAAQDWYDDDPQTYQADASNKWYKKY